jgi:hypothetical protein
MQLTFKFQADDNPSDAANGTSVVRKRSRHSIVHAEWFPWPDKIVSSSISLLTVVDLVVL